MSRAGRPAPPRRAGLARALVAVLSAGSAAVRGLRALRRSRRWNWLRGALLAVAVPLAAMTDGWQRAAALAAALVLACLRRTADPDRERRLQRAHGAEYLLNGGEWAGSPLGEGADRLRPGARLYLLLRGPHLLLLPRVRHPRVHSAIRVAEIERILVDGREYVPVYVSQAKQPPVRVRDFDRHEVSVLLLEARQGEPLRFRYRGPFASHLAETAAHAVYSVRRGVLPAVGGG